MMNLSSYAGLLLLAYCLGSIPFGLVLTRVFSHPDIRSQGSGNIGATNVLRMTGLKLGAITLLLDMTKGIFPVGLGLYMLGGIYGFEQQIVLSLVALAAIGGHLFPIYLGLKDGGKGVATAWGCFLVLSPTAACISLIVFLSVAAASKKVSLASLTAAVVLPIAIWYTTGTAILTLCATLVTVSIVIRHQQNIVRLLNRNEPDIF